MIPEEEIINEMFDLCQSVQERMQTRIDVYKASPELQKIEDAIDRCQYKIVHGEQDLMPEFRRLVNLWGIRAIQVHNSDSREEGPASDHESSKTEGILENRQPNRENDSGPKSENVNKNINPLFKNIIQRTE